MKELQICQIIKTTDFLGGGNVKLLQTSVVVERKSLVQQRGIAEAEKTLGVGGSLFK